MLSRTLVLAGLFICNANAVASASHRETSAVRHVALLRSDAVEHDAIAESRSRKSHSRTSEDPMLVAQSSNVSITISAGASFITPGGLQQSSNASLTLVAANGSQPQPPVVMQPSVVMQPPNVISDQTPVELSEGEHYGLPLTARRFLLAGAVLVFVGLLLSWLRRTWCQPVVLPRAGLPDELVELSRRRHVLQGCYHLEVFLEMTLMSAAIPSSYDLVQDCGYGVLASGWLIGVGYVLGTVGACGARYFMSPWHQDATRSAILIAQGTSVLTAVLYATAANPHKSFAGHMSDDLRIALLIGARLLQGACTYFTGTLLKMMGIHITPAAEMTSFMVYQNSVRNLGIGAGPLICALSCEFFGVGGVRAQASLPIIVIACLLGCSNLFLRYSLPTNLQPLLRAKHLLEAPEVMAVAPPPPLPPRPRSRTPPRTPPRSGRNTPRSRPQQSEIWTTQGLQSPKRNKGVSPRSTPRGVSPRSIHRADLIDGPEDSDSATGLHRPCQVLTVAHWRDNLHSRTGLEESDTFSDSTGRCYPRRGDLPLPRTDALPHDDFSVTLRRHIWLASVRSSCYRAFICMALESAATQILEVIFHYNAADVGLAVGFAFITGAFLTPMINYLWARTRLDSSHVLCMICLLNAFATVCLFPHMFTSFIGQGQAAVMPMLFAISVITPLGYHAMGIAEALALEFAIPNSNFNAQNLSLVFVIANNAVARFIAPPLVRFVLRTSGRSTFALVILVCTCFLCIEAFGMAATVHTLRKKAEANQIDAIVAKSRTASHSAYVGTASSDDAPDKATIDSWQGRGSKDRAPSFGFRELK